MNPIFNEYLTFLRDTSGKQLSDLKEGYFWLDNQIIKGFDKQGNIHKFYRISISDDLKLAFHGNLHFLYVNNFSFLLQTLSSLFLIFVLVAISKTLIKSSGASYSEI